MTDRPQQKPPERATSVGSHDRHPAFSVMRLTAEASRAAQPVGGGVAVAPGRNVFVAVHWASSIW